MATQKTYLIIGGCGFLGGHIVDYLINRGEKHVKVFDKFKNYENPKTEELILGDMTKIEDLKKACKGVNTVIHTASLAAHNKTYNEYHQVNVVGTQNVIDACRSQGVTQLVFTSSASVVFYGQDIHNGNEDLPYCKKHMDAYNLTKQLGEEMVLAANGKDGLMTCALRPSAIFGPRDVQAWPGFMEVIKKKPILGKFHQTRLILGDGTNKIDWSYVENVAYAHVLASDMLTTGSPVGGQKYFITNGEPTRFWDMARYCYQTFDSPINPPIHLNKRLMFIISSIIVFFVWLLSFIGIKVVPTFTPFRVTNATANRYFSIEKARKEMKYEPIVSLKEGMERTAKYFKEKERQKK